MARYYDMIYHELVDYKGECDYIEKIWRRHSGRELKSVLDIGCGTGNHAFILARRGHSVTGIDRSREMLNVARQKARGLTINPVFFKMDMRQIKLDRTFDAAVGLFGGFGYLLKDRDVKSFLSAVRGHIPDGLLIYEFWQSSAVRPEASSPRGHNTWDRIRDKRKNRLLIRLNKSRYDPETKILTVIFETYVLETKKRKLIDSFSESHQARTYSISEMKRSLTASGFTPLAFYHGDLGSKALKPAKPLTFRVTCVAAPLTATPGG